MPWDRTNVHWSTQSWARNNIGVVPDIEGLTGAEAIAAVEAAGFVAESTVEYSSSVPLGDVISQSPEADEDAPLGSTITFVISLGSQLEDFTTYVELDEDGDITITAPKVDVNTMRRDALSRVYKDFGAGTFGNFEIDFEFQITNMDSKCLASIFSLANGIGSTTDLYDSGSGIGLSITIYGNDGNLRIRILGHNGNTDDYFINGASTDLIYATITRSTTTVTLYLYSDAERTNVLDTLIITGDAIEYKYLYSLKSWNDSSVSDSHVVSGYTQNFDIISSG